MENIPHNARLSIQVQALIKAMEAVQKLIQSLDEELRIVNNRIDALEKMKTLSDGDPLNAVPTK